MLIYPVNHNFQQANNSVSWPQVTLFENDDFGGAQLGPIFMATDLYVIGSIPWKQTSSIVIAAGVWEFFKGVGFTGPALRLGPGRYRSVSEAANDPSWNDSIQSLRYVSI